MNTIVITAIILVSANFRPGEAINGDEHIKASDVPSVILGLYLVFDEDARSEWQKRVTIDIDDYLYTMTKTAEKVHFGNVTCTNITLMYMGSTKLNTSSRVEVVRDVYLDVDATLPRFRDYAYRNRDTFGQPDVTVLITSKNLENGSNVCSTRASSPEYSAYCTNVKGGAYENGICGNNSVAIVQDSGIYLHGASGLAQQIVRLMGVVPDNLRNDSECPKKGVYFTTSGWRNTGLLTNLGLSDCAEADLIRRIESIRNSSSVCWMDVPNVKTREFDIEKKDICAWRKPEYNKCNNTTGGNGPCYQYCCIKKENCSVQSEIESGCEQLKSKAFYLGKPCEDDGMCFEGECFKPKY